MRKPEPGRVSKPFAVLASAVCAMVILAGIATAANELAGYEFFTLTEGNVPATPASGDWTLYATASGLTVKDDAGATTTLGAGGGGFTVFLPAGTGAAAPSDVTFPSSLTLDTGVTVLAFSGTTNTDNIFFFFLLPEAYDSGADIDITLVVSSAGTTQTVNFDVSVATLTGEDLNGTGAGAIHGFLDSPIAHDFATNGTLGILTYSTISSANGLIDAAAAGDYIVIEVERQGSDDASNVLGYLHGLQVSQ